MQKIRKLEETPIILNKLDTIYGKLFQSFELKILERTQIIVFENLKKLLRQIQSTKITSELSEQIKHISYKTCLIFLDKLFSKGTDFFSDCEFRSVKKYKKSLENYFDFLYNIFSLKIIDSLRNLQKIFENILLNLSVNLIKKNLISRNITKNCPEFEFVIGFIGIN